MNIKVLISIFISLVNISTKAENPCQIMMPRGSDQDWGNGCWIIPDNFQINIYDDLDGSIYGKLYTQYSQIKLVAKNNISINIEYSDIEYVGHYGNELIKSKQCFNPNFVRVLWKTSKKILYLDKSELKKSEAEFREFKDFLFDKDLIKKFSNTTLNLGINLNKSCLNLRKHPNNNSTKIKCLKGNDWGQGFCTGIRIIKRLNNWAEVEYFEMHSSVKSIENDEDCNYIERNNQVGWIKAIDDNGFPNIWYSVSSY